ncbi:2-keto-4-pentenoate hydratase/2-oxohepta-3-ene-1,7-dioic acid hydratase in catechol pathway [Kineococcus radiotolerans]|uniref:2-keto-4-pentenoate hydratase/2-oxohepta-3-ene-1,7-dioic acid hydratase in catechol pathway n=1 Tax=Kineococcus radiotolerans TaxID=131568 RepID=A0A7W4TP62_KINRA|nr:fumarylacetoacetate hydrolase family protein [Kineococcus radiotolerans]MBB2902540.1 2-keto-4-pentenoate hydratase/2-oxohepta-3-ene-1,7-dioic acid hydratase in catechol pathway [Kineococcus radiotolerans]
MKILRTGPPGEETAAALLPDGSAVDLTGVLDAHRPWSAADLDRAASAVRAGLPALDLTGRRVGAPLPRPGTIVCIGLNYRDHAAETGAQLPTEPVVFLKSSSTVVGPHDTLLIPRGSSKTDYEVELGVVLGARARYLESAEAALEVVAGFVVSHDVSEREFQLERGGQWDKGKSCETFNPLGPWFVTADEVADVGALGLRTWVNGELRQDGSTADLVFGVAEVIRYLSWFTVLEPGDLVNTGTPAGVALGQPDPKPYLRPGDVVECEIDGLGRTRNVAAAA